MKKQKVTLLCGLPGSGKSTWLKKNAKNSVIISPDLIRRDMLGHQFHRPAEPLIWWLTESMAHLILAQGKSVAIDATSIFSFVRRKWGTIADQYDAAKELIWLDVPEEVCWKRNLKRGKKKQVPRSAFDRMSRAFQAPDKDECEADGFKLRRIK
jgi:protein phosphatase